MGINVTPSNYSNKIIIPIEIFITEIIEKENDKYQLYYCLGLINFYLKKDFVLAKKYFNNFIVMGHRKSQFASEVLEAEKIINIIENGSKE